MRNWLAKRGTTLDDNGELYSLRTFANVSGIPYPTLKHYVTEDVSKRWGLGKSVGRKPLVLHADQHFVADVLARKDKGNNGASRAEAIAMVQTFNPGLDRKQASRHYSPTLTTKF